MKVKAKKVLGEKADTQSTASVSFVEAEGFLFLFCGLTYFIIAKERTNLQATVLLVFI